jgi:ribosome modulation factor
VAEVTKKAKQLAYEAGRNMRTEPSERKSLEACPFEEGDPQRAEWLRGFSDALDEQAKEIEVHKEIREALKNA